MKFSIYFRYTNIIYLFIGFYFLRECNLLLKNFYNIIIMSYKYIRK